MSTFKTKQTHSVSKYVIQWPPATIIDELHLFANKYAPYLCHVSNQVNAWVNKPAQHEALATISAGCWWRPSTANGEVRLPGVLKWQRSSSVVVLSYFQRATLRTELNLETRLYRSQLSLIQVLTWHKRGIAHTLIFMDTPAMYSLTSRVRLQAVLRESWDASKPGLWVLYQRWSVRAMLNSSFCLCGRKRLSCLTFTHLWW